MTNWRVLIAVSAFIGVGAHADEGMWTFDNFPAAALKVQHGATIDKAWLDNVRTATVRLAGCTGSFVSKDGLILTNHHCVASCVDQLSSKQDNLLEKGILTRDREQERRCPTQIADVLMVSENVTDKVSAAVKGLSEQAANEARKQTLTRLEQSCEEASKRASGGPLKCESVALYNGGQYFIYKYKRYTDLRMVFAPEANIAAFGGDPDNFQYPRWCLDMGIMRAYENGKPISTPNHLKINFAGPNAGEVVFVPGHPGSTDRLLTISQLLEQRNVDLPEWLLRNSELRGRLL
ncbi:MAG TPA: S46 family peptidase, partial [Steroidobacteraceae bacterium]|nr:S46 family peptidase [Steroidobacteraceae bacterium]